MLRTLRMSIVALSISWSACGESEAETVPRDDVSAAPPRAAPPPQTPSIEKIRAFGNEPFWSVTVGPDSIRLLDMARADTLSWGPVAPIEALGRETGFARAWVLDPAGPVVLAIRRAPDGCSDGMSDNSYPWFSLFLNGDRLYEGCARPDRDESDGD